MQFQKMWLAVGKYLEVGLVFAESCLEAPTRCCENQRISARTCYVKGLRTQHLTGLTSGLEQGELMTSPFGKHGADPIKTSALRI